MSASSRPMGRGRIEGRFPVADFQLPIATCAGLPAALAAHVTQTGRLEPSPSQTDADSQSRGPGLPPSGSQRGARSAASGGAPKGPKRLAGGGKPPEGKPLSYLLPAPKGRQRILAMRAAPGGQRYSPDRENLPCLASHQGHLPGARTSDVGPSEVAHLPPMVGHAQRILHWSLPAAQSPGTIWWHPGPHRVGVGIAGSAGRPVGAKRWSMCVRSSP